MFASSPINISSNRHPWLLLFTWWQMYLVMVIVAFEVQLLVWAGIQMRGQKSVSKWFKRSNLWIRCARKKSSSSTSGTFCLTNCGRVWVIFLDLLKWSIGCISQRMATSWPIHTSDRFFSSQSLETAPTSPFLIHQLKTPLSASSWSKSCVTLSVSSSKKPFGLLQLWIPAGNGMPTRKPYLGKPRLNLIWIMEGWHWLHLLQGGQPEIELLL